MIIGLSQRVLTYREREYDSLSRDFYKFFKGHTLLPIPNGYSIDYDALVNQIDIFVITGGEAHPDRTQTELLIAQKMTSIGKPVVGICYGAFLLTEVLKGSVQTKYTMPHGVDHKIFYHTDLEEYEVNSFHNQIITHEPPGSEVLCSDEYGYVEAWVKGNVAAVVWHPERMNEPWVPSEINNLLKKQLQYVLH